MGLRVQTTHVINVTGGIVPTASQPASQLPCPSGGEVLPRAARGQWLGMESQAGLCSETSLKATLWMKAQHEGALPPPCIVRKDPRVPQPLPPGSAGQHFPTRRTG